MLTVIKYLFFFALAYSFWIATGGIERGEQRRAEGDDQIFVEFGPTKDLQDEHGNPFDNAVEKF